MNATKPPCLSENYRHVSYASTSLALVFNAIVIVLIVFRTTKEMKVYSRVLLSNCIVDMVFLSVSFVVDMVRLMFEQRHFHGRPVQHISFRYGIAYYVVGGFFAESSLEFKFAMTCVYLFALYLAIFAVTPPFIYRYFVVCRNYVFTKLQFAGLMMIELLLAISIAVYVWLSCWSYAEKTANEVDALDVSCVDPGQVPYFHVSDARSLQVGSLLLYAGTLVMINFTIAVICSYKIMRTLSSLTSTGRRESSFNKQLNTVLILQAVTPFIVAVIPLIGCLGMLLFSYDNAGVLMESVTSVESFVPVLNPLYTICFVKSYRRSIIGLCKGTVAPVGSTTNRAASK